MTKTLQQLDPKTLVVGTNVRIDSRLEAPFLASVKERGVLEPVLAHLDVAGAVVVDQGQRRTLAAAQLGLATIPVVVDDQAPKDADRLVDQWVENEHRESLSNSERIRAVEQMALVGLTPAQIAKRTATSKTDVARATAAAVSPTAVKFADQGSLEDAAILAEFEGDEQATEQLLRYVGSVSGLAATAQRIRDDQAEQKAIADKAAELTEQGRTVIDPPHWDDKKTERLDYLRDGKKRLDPEKHVTCPGHVVWIQPGWVGRERGLNVIAGCRDWAKQGHTTSLQSGQPGKKASDQMTDAEKETARRERRHVIDSNKDWKAATTVRRRWLQQFVQRKTAPDGAETLVAAGVVNGWTQYLNSYNPSGDAWKILGTTQEAVDRELATASPKRALQIALAVTLGCWEAATSDDTWRTSVETSKAAAVLVLQAISQWGHQLSDIEGRIVEGTAAAPQQAAA